MLSYEAMMFLGLIAALYVTAALIKKLKPSLAKRIGLAFEGPAIMIKTTALNPYISAIGRKYRRLWSIYGIISIIAGLVLAAYGVYVLHVNAWLLLRGAAGAAPTHPVIPGVTVSFEALPYVAFACFLALVPHELTHGFLVAAEKIKIRTSGVLLFLFIPGGFVEPDEDELEKAPPLSQFKIYASGTFTNFLTALMVAVISLAVLVPSGVIVRGTLPGTPASKALREGDVVIALNGTEIRSLIDLTRYLSTTRPNDTIKVTVLREGRMINITVKLIAHPYNSTRGFIGAYFADYFSADPQGTLLKLFWWSYVVTISVAVINIMPIYPLDGGRILFVLLKKYVDEDLAKNITYAITLYLVLVLFVNVALSIARWGLRAWYP